MLALGTLAGLWLVYRRARRTGLIAGKVVVGTALVVAVGLVGSRLGVVVLDVRYYLAHRQEILTLYGTGFQGGLVASIGAAIVVARWLRISAWQYLDLLAPGILLGQAIGRIGCLLNGCCCGRVTDSFLALYLPDAQGNWALRYPTQAMHALANLSILAALLKLERRSPFRGYIWLLFVILYSVQRWLIDLLRESGPLLAGLRATRLVSAITILAACLLLGYQWASTQRDARPIG